MDTSLEYLRLDPLRTRIETHRRYSEHHDDVEATVLGELDLTAGESLLDVGCGTGSFLARLRSQGHTGALVGVDSSPAAVAAAAAVPGVRAVLADAARLPFPDGGYDAVTARHMLYHVADPTAALREARRTLRPGGRFVAVVNHAVVTPLIADVVRQQAERFGVDVPASPNAKVNSGTLPGRVAAVFGDVRTCTFDNQLVFDAPAPVTAFGQALLGLYGVGEDSPVRELVADGIAAAVREWFAEHDGPWRDPKGYVVCLARR